MSRRLSTQEDYFGRLAKFIPAEIVALYVAAVGVIPHVPAGTPNFRALWIVFGITLALVPLYLFFATKRGGKKPLPLQIVLATVAFPVWVFAMGGPFESFPWYQGWAASLVLIFVTFGFGFFKSPPES